MAFFIDNRTEEDLNIYTGKKTVLGLFSRTSTKNGSKILESMMRYPPSSETGLEARKGCFIYFIKNKIDFPFSIPDLESAENYIYSADKGILTAGNEKGFINKLNTKKSEDYSIIKNGIRALIALIDQGKSFIKKTEKHDLTKSGEFLQMRNDFLTLFENESFEKVSGDCTLRKFDMESLSEADNVFRRTYKNGTTLLFDLIYRMDAICSVASCTISKHFVFAQFAKDDETGIEVKGLYHPFLKSHVDNDLIMDPSQNVLFLTGSNMSGKSTLMKALGISIFLAHIGFPVPASAMKVRKLNGLFTTINLTDDFNKGYSYFYSEVMRVKTIVKAMEKQNLAVLFDEIFRGTNVKDAYEATISIVDLMSTFRHSLTLVSSHIADAADALVKSNKKIRMCYLLTNVKDSMPVATYELKEGICRDRFGLTILKSVHPFDPENRICNNENFITDKQTLDDLNLSAKLTRDSIYMRYNGAKTMGGKKLFDEIYKQPLASADKINKRTNFLRGFIDADFPFPFSQDEMLDISEFYIRGNISPIRLRNLYIQKNFLKDVRYDQYKDLVIKVVCFVKKFAVFSSALLELKLDGETKTELQKLSGYAHVILEKMKGLTDIPEKFDLESVIFDSRLMGYKFSGEISDMIKAVYRIDVAMAIAIVYRKYGLSFAHAVEEKEASVNFTDVTFPFMKNAVPNSIRLGGEENLMIVTGPNMAGKSTIMRSIGANLYLAHIGFPVFARDLSFSVFDGIYSTINLSDNINMHYSHYFAEVMRVKEIAGNIAGGKRIFVIFDELFKGTNVKDAYDATHYVISEFLKNKKSLFLISTHISEVTKALQDEKQPIQFRYLDSGISDKNISYTYKLKEGISESRFGMYIIKKEGIIS